MDDSVLLSIDQGTTSSRAILFSKAGEILDGKTLVGLHLLLALRESGL